MDKIVAFQNEVKERISLNGKDTNLKKAAKEWLKESMQKNYVYNFSWMGRPIIQNPMDILAMQEIIWRIKPDLIIETGIAHGGSLIFSASMLELIGEEGEVLGIDIDIREHNKKEIEKHQMYKRITMIEGSSISNEVIEKVYSFAKNKKRILIFLDSNHSHNHVLKELQMYSPLVSIDSYIIAFDGFVEEMPEEYVKDRPWGKGNNAQTATLEFISKNDTFIIDKDIENQILITCAPNGFLKRVK